MVASIVCPPEEARRYVDAGYLVFEEPARAVRALAALRQIADAFDRPARTVDVPAEMPRIAAGTSRSEEHTSELQSLMRISYAVFCLKKKKHIIHRKADDKNVENQTLIRKYVHTIS